MPPTVLISQQFAPVEPLLCSEGCLKGFMRGHPEFTLLFFVFRVFVKRRGMFGFYHQLLGFQLGDTGRMPLGPPKDFGLCTAPATLRNWSQSDS